MTAISKFNELINNKIRQDAQNGILDNESIYVAKHIMEKIKTKSDINVKLANLQLETLFKINEDKNLNEIISTMEIYVYK